MAENVPNLKKETDIQAQETEGPKQGKSKQTYTRQDLFLHRNTAGRKGMARCIQSPERESLQPEILYWNKEFPEQVKTKTIQQY